MTVFRLEQVIHAATSHVLAAMADGVDKALQQMGAQALAAHSNLQRQVLQRAERELQFKKGPLLAAFGQSYREEVARFLGEKSVGAGAERPETDWTALTLVDDAEVERGVQADRLAQQMAQGCEAELEVLSACIAGLMEGPGADAHPLRPKVIAQSMLAAVAELDGDDDVTQALGQQLGRVLSEDLGLSLSRIATDWRDMGIRPQSLQMARTRSGMSVSGNPGTSPASLSGMSVHTLPGGLNPHHAQPGEGARGFPPSGNQGLPSQTLTHPAHVADGRWDASAQAQAQAQAH